MTTFSDILLRRFAIVVVGYVVACLAASAFLFLTFFGLLLSFSGSRSVQTEDLWRLVSGGALMIPTGAVLVAYAAFLPSAAVIPIAEFFGRRGWLTYAAAGGAVSLMAAGILLPSSDFVLLSGGFGFPTGRSAIESPIYPFALLIGGGMCGGLAYWAVAGRRTPDWRRKKGMLPTSPAR